MRFTIVICFLLLPLSISAQEEQQVKLYSSSLEVGDYLIFRDNSLRFKEVISDSRCPKDVTCVWAGEAKILVELYRNGSFLKEKILTLSNSTIPLEFSVQGVNYSINKMVLYPYPTTKLVDPDYSLEIMIVEEVI